MNYFDFPICDRRVTRLGINPSRLLLPIAIALAAGHTGVRFSRGIFMWGRLKNLRYSIQTYRDLSPNVAVRRQVNRHLRQRPARSSAQWLEGCQSIGISRSIAQFSYAALQRYSGLNFAHVRPADRLEADLQWTEICGYDWQLDLCDDVQQQFEVDLSDRLDQIPTGTVADLLLFLQQQVCDWVRVLDDRL